MANETGKSRSGPKRRLSSHALDSEPNPVRHVLPASKVFSERQLVCELTPKKPISSLLVRI